MFTDWHLYQRRALQVALVALAIVFVIWNVPQLQVIKYPFNLFVTFMHESGHGLAAILTGGRLSRFIVYSNGGGLAYTIGGARWLVLPAGYLGAAFFGSVLFFLVNRVPYPRFIAFALGAWMMGFSLLFAWRSPTALIVGLSFGVALALLGWRANRYVVTLVLDVLALMTALNAVLDIWYLVGAPSAGAGPVTNDAAAFAELFAVGPPTEFWAFLWAALAVGMFGVAVYFGVVRPLVRAR